MISLPDLSDAGALAGLLATYACALLRLLPLDRTLESLALQAECVVHSHSISAAMPALQM
jgi:hypothetical protein